MTAEKLAKVFTFINDLKQKVLTHPVMIHPFWSRFRKGHFTWRQLQVFGMHYYQHVKQTRLYVATVLARTPFEEVQGALSSILWDEYGRGDMDQTHPAQFRKMLRALHLTETDWEASPPLAELEMYTDIHCRLCNDYNVWVGLGVVGIAMELPIPTLYAPLIEGLTKSGLSKDDVQFFVMHGPMDVHHVNLFLNSMVPYLDSKEDQEAMRYGAIRSLDARFVLMNGLYKTVSE